MSVTDATDDSPLAPSDVAPSTDVVALRDAPSATVSMAVLTNPAAAGHPAVASVVTLSDTNLVALSPRIFISGPSTTGTCSFAVWIGTSAGGDFSAAEAFESVRAGAGDGGQPDCFARGVGGVIPADVAIGDTIGALRGKLDVYCPRGSTCPAGASLELDVAASVGGLVTVSGHGGSVPAPTVVHVADINGTGTTLAPRDLALQNALVQINGAILRTAPSAASHDNMLVADTAGASAPGMNVVVSKYRGVTCQRTLLGAAAPGFAVGTVIGILEYSFGNWEIQPRQTSDLSGATCAASDAGVTDSGVTDAGAADAR